MVCAASMTQRHWTAQTVRMATSIHSSGTSSCDNFRRTFTAALMPSVDPILLIFPIQTASVTPSLIYSINSMVALSCTPVPRTLLLS